jgi:hypothetical protein
MVAGLYLSAQATRMHVQGPRTRLAHHSQGNQCKRVRGRAESSLPQRQASRVAKKSVKRGRWYVAGGLIVFVIVAAAVIARRSYGHKEGLELTALQRRKAALESERVRLDQQIRDGSSMSVIVPKAQRLGMRMPSESQIIVLRRSGDDGTP